MQDCPRSRFWALLQSCALLEGMHIPQSGLVRLQAKLILPT